MGRYPRFLLALLWNRSKIRDILSAFGSVGKSRRILRQYTAPEVSWKNGP
jgi:hypothetical protein